MAGTTASGWPYITDTDEPIDYDAQSLALANKLEAEALRTADIFAGYGITRTTAGRSVTLSVTTPVLVLGPLDPVPESTPIGTVIIRTE